ncbi:M14 family metallocarboxypeptidase [Shewanella sp. WXL01]|uniref:M14 family metallopeptidase n=1 Tax=Shewanella sp. WXL01 TaxID=2709721 RepID=UPI0014382A7A|nr:M14 family metallocarboxypeptidase [Shewanella sp. WXL01]NKF51658.1 M14 family metallocarboxypeptidase [Shewanella sp. WXL01]
MSFYPIGVQGQPWTDEHKAQWLAQTSVKRSYQQEVLTKLEAVSDEFERVQYGALSYNVERFPLVAFKSANWDDAKKTVLVTGGVHGYETSGVQGAIAFLLNEANRYHSDFNFIIAPCVSPWGYETINRWNPNAVDPNRSFYEISPAEESAALMALLQKQVNNTVFVHFDLHETTDTDELEFRPALAARDGKDYVKGVIPDGFYLVGDTDNPNPAFQKAINDSVAKVTHVAPDDDGQLIGVDIEQFGVINYPTKKLGLCAGMTNNQFNTTTEVYPDSPKATPQQCIDAQVAAIIGGLDYLLGL